MFRHKNQSPFKILRSAFFGAQIVFDQPQADPGKEKKRPSTIARDGRLKTYPRYHPNLRPCRTLHKVKKPLLNNGSPRPALTPMLSARNARKRPSPSLPIGRLTPGQTPTAPSLNCSRQLLLLFTASNMIHILFIVYHPHAPLSRARENFFSHLRGFIQIHLRI